MIKGIGTDIVSIARFVRLYTRYPERSMQRLLAPSERVHFMKTQKPAAFLAKRFALKEAIVKALGTGFRGISLQDIVITSNALGAPQLAPSLRIQERLSELGVTHVHLSVSDETEYAVAFVILSGGQ
jgi:holo-[acyl-carrier protein] synthase